MWRGSVWIAVESDRAFTSREIQLVLMAAEKISSVEVGSKKSLYVQSMPAHSRCSSRLGLI